MKASYTTAAKIMGKAMRLAFFGMVFVICSSFQQEVISGDLERLIGDYELICVFDNGKKTDSGDVVDKYTLRITKKSELLVYKNGKKKTKYRFSDVQVPMDYEYEYVMFSKGNQYYPLFYKGDTVVMHIYPFEFQDNYFRKTIKE